MKNQNFTDILKEAPWSIKGFSQDQTAQTPKNENVQWYYLELASGLEKKDKKSGKDQGGQEGPRPPKEDEFPDEEKEELFSEVSDPEEKE